MIRLALFFMAAAAVCYGADAPVTITAGATTLAISRRPFAASISVGGSPTVQAHPGGGLLLGDADHPEPAVVESESFDENGGRVLSVRTDSGHTARVFVSLTPHQADFLVRPSAPMAVLMRFGPASPGFGLADHAVVGRTEFDTEITGYRNDRYLSGAGLTRLVSNFVIYPRQHFAFLVWHPGVKVVRSTTGECTQGAQRTAGDLRFTVFIGSPREIYRQFLEARNLYGYAVMKPKYEFFGVGWEAFGALAWDTNHDTVTENVNRYLAEGYPLQWMVVGSGFWPRGEARFHETTSFGFYDKALYPDPAGFIAQFHRKGV